MEDWYDLARVHEDDAVYHATPWKDASELLALRAQLFGLNGLMDDDERQRALHRV